MSDTSTTGLILGFLGVCLTQGVGWYAIKIQASRTENKLDQVGRDAGEGRDEAATAAKRIEPVSNGFAGKVLAGIDELRQGQQEHGQELAEIRRRLDAHIGDHASADVLRPRQ